MKRTITGVVLAAIVLFLWGYLYWGMGPYRTMVWNQSTDDVAAGKALLEYFPQNGTYYVPGFDQDPKTVEALFESGPVAFVHILAIAGGPVVNPVIMIQGFILNLVVIILVAVLLRQVRSAFLRIWIASNSRL